MKTTTVIPASDVLAAHELAALEISELRRKGVQCHLEEHADAFGRRIDIVREPPHPADGDSTPREGD
jgi:hypothetical protein